MLPKSKLVKSQKMKVSDIFGLKEFTVTLRYDDECGNGHNTFSITGDFDGACGCIHDEIAKRFPELKKYIKWHLTSSEGPMHYIANSMYWAYIGNLENARASAVWPEAENYGAFLRETLEARLPKLMEEFEADMIGLGFEY